MQLKTLVNSAVRNAIHNASEELYLKTGVDVTKPIWIKGQINERCNYKCRYCNFWRQSDYKEEMTIQEWQAALLSLKEFIGSYLIQFSGGEPFIKKGFVELLQFCHSEGINWGVITNGSMFDCQTVEKVVAARPTNIDISIDSGTAEIHDFVRGVPGSLSKIVQGIGFLREESKRQGVKFPIRIKPTVHLYNFHVLPELVEWVQQVGATTIDFSPVAPVTSEVTTEMLPRQEQEIATLQQTVETLIEMKQHGAPIETSELKLRSFLDRFRGKPVDFGVTPCRLSLRDYYIRVDGQVKMCMLYPPLGNVKTQSAREIWCSEETKKIRAQMVACTKLGTAGCKNFCLSSQKPFLHQVQRGLLLLRRTAKS